MRARIVKFKSAQTFDVPVARVVANAGEFHYEEAGQGSPVVLVHGGLSDPEEWAPLLSHLSAGHRVIAYSRRNAYPNEARDHVPWGVAEHAADLAALIVELGANPVHLVGESYGAFVALVCAMRNPDLVRRLVLDEPPIPSLLTSPADVALRREFEDLIAGARRSLEGGDPESAVRDVINYLEGNRETYAMMPPPVRATILRNVEAFRLELEAGLPEVSREELRRLALPTLLLASTIGPRTLSRVTAVVAECIPGARLASVPGTTHGSIIFSPDYMRVVEGFLAGTW